MMICSKARASTCTGCGKETYDLVVVQFAPFHPSVCLCPECAKTLHSATKPKRKKKP